MIHSPQEMRNWKKEQIDYFKRYLINFKQGSKEYTLLKDGIEKLEKSN